MCLLTQSHATFTIRTFYNASTITDSNRIIYCISRFTQCNRAITYRAGIGAVKRFGLVIININYCCIICICASNTCDFQLLAFNDVPIAIYIIHGHITVFINCVTTIFNMYIRCFGKVSNFRFTFNSNIREILFNCIVIQIIYIDCIASVALRICHIGNRSTTSFIIIFRSTQSNRISIDCSIFFCIILNSTVI